MCINHSYKSILLVQFMSDIDFYVPGGKTCFTQGGINDYCKVPILSSNEVLLMPRERLGYFGWDGFGGSVMQWHPELEIGFGYVPSKLRWYYAYSEVGASLQKAVVDCINGCLGKSSL